MKVLSILLIISTVLGSIIPYYEVLNNNDKLMNDDIIYSTSAIENIDTDQLVNRDLLSIGKKKAKGLKKIFSKKKKLVKELEAVVFSLQKIEKIKGADDDEGDWEEEDGDKSSISDLKDELIETLLTKVFISLKNSDLINPILKFSLTDDKVRSSIVDITVELLKADVIPYYEIFVALRDSGLAIQVIQFLLTDPETRQGQIDLIIELIPRLLEDGVINFEDILKNLPTSLPFNDWTFPSKTLTSTNPMITSNVSYSMLLPGRL